MIDDDHLIVHLIVLPVRRPEVMQRIDETLSHLTSEPCEIVCVLM